MSYYHEFQNTIGKCVEIRCHDGKVYRGYIDHCDNDNVSFHREKVDKTVLDTEAIFSLEQP